MFWTRLAADMESDELFNHSKSNIRWAFRLAAQAFDYVLQNSTEISPIDRHEFGELSQWLKNTISTDERLLEFMAEGLSITKAFDEDTMVSEEAEFIEAIERDKFQYVNNYATFAGELNYAITYASYLVLNRPKIELENADYLNLGALRHIIKTYRVPSVHIL